MAAALQNHSVAASQPFAPSSLLNLLPAPLPSMTWMYTTVAIVVALLALEQSVYRYKKSHLPGDRWTIPLIGKFADSMKPTMEGYQRQWASGALSAVSVFNMCVSISDHIPYSCLYNMSFVPWSALGAIFSLLGVAVRILPVSFILTLGIIASSSWHRRMNTRARF